ncbi:hypothetical protein TNCV_2867131 [Trichonephila clavipes]|nr:hypothetical protein TNCV_2867131 [Trichonephila clavipes]
MRKWVMYPNVKRRNTECRPSDPPASTSKVELHPKKMLLSVWWDGQGIIQSKIVPLNQTITAAFYCLQLGCIQIWQQRDQVSSIIVVLTFTTITPDHMLLSSLAKS